MSGASRRRRPGRHEDPGGRPRARAGRRPGPSQHAAHRRPRGRREGHRAPTAWPRRRPGVQFASSSGRRGRRTGRSTSRPDWSSRWRTSKAGTGRSPQPGAVRAPRPSRGDRERRERRTRPSGGTAPGVASGRFSACSGGRASAAGSSSTAGSRSATGRPGRSATCASRRGGGRARAGCAAAEAYAGRWALEQRARREARKRKTALFDIQRKRGRDGLTSGVWLRAGSTTSPATSSSRQVGALGAAIGSAVTLLDVELVVIGGGLGERLGHLAPEDREGRTTRSSARQRATRSPSSGTWAGDRRQPCSAGEGRARHRRRARPRGGGRLQAARRRLAVLGADLRGADVELDVWTRKWRRALHESSSGPGSLGPRQPARPAPS